MKNKLFLKVLSELKLCFMAIGTFIGYFLGGFDKMLTTLLVFIVVDYLMGVMDACIQKEVSSKIGAKGIAKKVYMLLLVGIANITGDSLDIEGLRYIVISFYIANEGISILENATKIGVPIPQKIVAVLEQVKSKGEIGSEGRIQASE